MDRRSFLGSLGAILGLGNYLKDGCGRFTVSTKEYWSEVEERFNNIS